MSWDEWLASDSWLRRLDVRFKVAWLLSVTMLALIWEALPLLMGLLAGLWLIALSAGLSLRYLLRLMLFLAPLVFLSLLTQALFGEALLWRKLGRAPQVLFLLPQGWPWLGGHPVWREGVSYGLVVGLKSWVMALTAPLLFLSTGMDEMLSALEAVGVSPRLAFVFASTVRFFPLLFDEAQAIIEAQRTRGLAPEEVEWRGKLAFYGRIAVPLILGAMLRARRMEMVVLARGFPPAGKRTSLYEVQMRSWERWGIAVALGVLAAASVARLRWGIGRF